jgi:hypothetical protein
MSVEPGSWQQLDNRFYRYGIALYSIQSVFFRPLSLSLFEK